MTFDVLLFPACKKTREGTEYAGSLSHTLSGYPCQCWDTQAPHPHNMTDPDRFPDATLGQAANYCRNPDGSPGGPWCYTTHSEVMWEKCDITFCSGMFIAFYAVEPKFY